MIGYLGNELECPPIIRAYLAHWHGLHNILWAKQSRDTTPINEKHYNLLCPDNVNSFRLYVHTPTPPNSDYNIIEFNGSKSRFSRKMSTRCNSACSPANIQSVLSASGEIVDDQKSRLESYIAEINAKMTPLEDILKEKKRLNQETKNEIYDLKDQRNRFQKDITDLKKIENILVSETKKRDETMKKLSRGVEKEKKTKMKEYEDSISNMITAVEETIKVCNAHTGYKVEGVCVGMARQGMVEQIRSVSDAISEAREGLEVFVKKVKDTQKSRYEHFASLYMTFTHIALHFHITPHDFTPH